MSVRRLLEKLLGGENGFLKMGVFFLLILALLVAEIIIRNPAHAGAIDKIPVNSCRPLVATVLNYRVAFGEIPIFTIKTNTEKKLIFFYGRTSWSLFEERAIRERYGTGFRSITSLCTKLAGTSVTEPEDRYEELGRMMVLSGTPPYLNTYERERVLYSYFVKRGQLLFFSAFEENDKSFIDFVIADNRGNWTILLTNSQKTKTVELFSGTDFDFIDD